MLLLVMVGSLSTTAQLRQPIRIMELNCENLFDCRHDSLKNDYEYLPDGSRHWTFSRYYRKLNNIAKEIVACADTITRRPPDLVALCEVENDSVMAGLTRMSMLRYSHYKYVMTNSPDPRGIDVALLYNPQIVEMLNHRSIRVIPPKGIRPTRDILYASCAVGVDTLHLFVLHTPSRAGGAKLTQPYRTMVAEMVGHTVDSILLISPNAKIAVTGDFNDYTGGKTFDPLLQRGLTDVSAQAQGSNGAKGTYKFRGQWGSLDHIMVSPSLAEMVRHCSIADLSFLLEDDKTYGGKKPLRTGYGNAHGFSDHLPLVADVLVNVE